MAESARREAPLIRWSDALRTLVDQDGKPLSDAQRYKASQILERGLLTLRGTRDRVRGVYVVNEYRCDPIPGNSTPHTLTHRQEHRGGLVVHSYTCTCQWARGGPNTPPRRCAHVLALIAYLRETGVVA